MKFTYYKVKVNFIRDVLGPAPTNPEIQKQYIKLKMMQGRTGMSGDIAQTKLDEEHTNMKKDKQIDATKEKALTVFYRNEKGIPCIADHQIRGWIKEVAGIVGPIDNWHNKKDGSGFKNEHYKNWIGSKIFFPKRWHNFAKKPVISIFDRPLRAMTMQGPRVSIASSECIPAGNSITIEFGVTPDVPKEYLVELFKFGQMRGISQWSNAQFGTFTFDKLVAIKQPSK